MKLASILNEELIFTGVPGTTREELYTQMLQRAAAVVKLDPAEVVAGLIQREDKLNIPYEGCAFPHLRDNRFEDLSVIIGVPAAPVKLKPEDCGPSRLIVMSLVSPDTSDLYLKSLAALVRFVQDPAGLAMLAEAGSPRQLLDALRDADVRVRQYLMAEDVMVPCKCVLHPGDTLSAALDLFSCTEGITLPVVGDHGELLGEMAAIDVLKRFIPEYVFRLENLDFLNSFEPFDRIFREENNLVVGDYMRAPSLTVRPDTPLIQFTVRMAKQDVRCCFVTGDENRLLGAIMVRHIVKKVLRG